MTTKPLLVVLTGAGMSVESGLSTFRGSGGLWEGYKIDEVASIEGWRKNPQKVIEFYNIRRRHALSAQPNDGHTALFALEKQFDVQIITQNVDILHEAAGSTQVMHLHGRLDQIISEKEPEKTITWHVDQEHDAWKAEKGAMRPNVVWFGEEVPLMSTATLWVQRADYFLVVGTSLQVYPAANLIHALKPNTPAWYIDPNPDFHRIPSRFTCIQATASEGIRKLEF
ncbi:MAG: SIR2 family NAD-dependent protein deacylase [Bacteroidia bacterium]|jgi:NAD-dependent deacetylase